MKILLLLLIVTNSMFAEKHYNSIQRHIIIARPTVTYGYYRPYYYYNPYYSTPVGVREEGCKKEKLKDSYGKKHEVLVCRQPDGSYKVVADSDHLN